MIYLSSVPEARLPAAGSKRREGAADASAGGRATLTERYRSPDQWGPGPPAPEGGQLHRWRDSDCCSRSALVFSRGGFAVTDTNTLRSASRELLVS